MVPTLGRHREKLSKGQPALRAGFTLVELLVAVGVIGVLCALLLPTLANARGRARTAKCLSNIRQLGIAGFAYASDSLEYLPPRRGPSNCWAIALSDYYGRSRAILHCPENNVPAIATLIWGDNPNPWLITNAYFINGFADYFWRNLTPENYNQLMTWQADRGMRLDNIDYPSGTILFGEKESGSVQLHMDVIVGGGNGDYAQIAQGRHNRSREPERGSANYTLCDGSARTLKFGRSINPINLWATTDDIRKQAIGF